MHTGRIDQALAVFLHALGGRLLIGVLDERLAILAHQRHVAGQNQKRRAGGIRGGDVHDHMGKARPFGARRGHDFARRARETVSHGAHRPFGAPAIGRNARGRDGIDDGIVARAAEQRSQILFLAKIGENLGAGHARARKAGFGRGLGKRVLERIRQTD